MQANTVVGYVAAAAAAGGLPTDWERLFAEVGLTEELAAAIRTGKLPLQQLLPSS